MPFNPDLALHSILPLAEAAYTHPLKLPDGWILGAQIQPDNFGFVASSKATPVVCFRGTESKHEWSEDFDAVGVPNKFGEGWVHQGFQEVYAGIRKSVLNALPKAPGQVLVTGHSLGAALAVLCAAELSTLGYDPTVYTWAGPRSGLVNFASWFDSRIKECYRIVNIWDIVPRVPLPAEGYKHVGQAIYVDGGETADVHVSHNLEKSYRPGLEKLISKEKAAAASA